MTERRDATWTAELRAQVGALSLDVSLDGDAGTAVLVGPNGAGKTTLLRILAGATTPGAGRIEVAGRVLYDTQAGIDLAPERRRVGYVPQGYGLFAHLSALDNVAFGLAHGPRRLGTRAHRRDRAMQMLEELDCARLASSHPVALSGGERQRVALARALVVEPELLLLDEPLSALDVASRRATRAFLVEHLRARGKPALVVTHDVRDLRALGASVFVLEGGRIVQRGTAEELSADPKSEFVSELLDVEPGREKTSK
ncbi:MAG: ABC transporter ATP-binding protein [Myxococcota bacterium]